MDPKNNVLALQRRPATGAVDGENLYNDISAHVLKDELVQTTQSAAPEGLEVLLKIRDSMAAQAAVLNYVQHKLLKANKIEKSIPIVTKHVVVLEKLAQLEMTLQKKLEHSRAEIDVKSPEMEKILILWVQKMRAVATEIMPPDLLDLFFARFATAMSTWEDEAAQALKFGADATSNGSSE